jgi:predicted  nucleic acid-binding Zn-ribbon protein
VATRQAKKELAAVQGQHAEQSKEMAVMRERLEQTNLELDDLLNTLKQVEKYNEEIKGEIAVNRRLTYASEELMAQKEKAKKEEDLQITLMQTRLKHQYEKQALYRAQLAGKWSSSDSQ